jgi:hypothetical protein
MLTGVMLAPRQLATISGANRRSSLNPEAWRPMKWEISP